MINKFQQGGQFDQIYALINQQPEQALQELVKQGLNPQQIMQLVAQGAQEGKIKPEIAQAIEKALQQQTQAARHGAKLNYLKSLKHQCAEDEEVYYFKKGGSVGCGCRKKEDGGEVTKASKGCSAIKKFKAERGKKVPEINPNDTIHVNGQVKSLTGKNIKDGNKEYKNLTKEEYQKLKLKDKQRVSEKDIKSGRTPESKCGSKLKKHQTGGFFYLPPTQKENYRPVTMSPNVSYPQNIKIEPVTKEPYVVKPQKTLLDKAKNFYNELKKRAAEQNNKRQELNKLILNSYGIGKYDPFETQRNKVY